MAVGWGLGGSHVGDTLSHYKVRGLGTEDSLSNQEPNEHITCLQIARKLILHMKKLRQRERLKEVDQGH